MHQALVKLNLCKFLLIQQFQTLRLHRTKKSYMSAALQHTEIYWLPLSITLLGQNRSSWGAQRQQVCCAPWQVVLKADQPNKNKSGAPFSATRSKGTWLTFLKIYIMLQKQARYCLPSPCSHHQQSCREKPTKRPYTLLWAHHTCSPGL